MLKKAIFVIIPVILIGSHLSQRVKTWLRVREEIAEIEANVERLEKEEKELLNKKEYYQTEEFIRREAREKLGLTNQNELVLILPELPDLPDKHRGRKISPNSPTWKQWWDLFFTKS